MSAIAPRASKRTPDEAGAARLQRLLRIAMQCSGSDGATLEIGEHVFQLGASAGEEASVAIVTEGAKLVLVKPCFPENTADIASLLQEETAVHGARTKLESAVAEAAAARADAEANAQRLAFALDMARTAAWELDLDGPRLVGGEELAKFFGKITAEDILQLHKSRLHPDDLPAFMAFQAQLQKGERADIEHRLRDPDGGALRWVRTTGVVLSRLGQRAPHYVFLTTDITERRMMEAAFAEAMREAASSLETKRALLEELVQDLNLDRPADEDCRPVSSPPAGPSRSSELHEQLALLLSEISRRDRALADAVGSLRRARADAEAASEAKTRFLNAMTHELRTPLNAIINYAEMVEEEILESGLGQCGADIARIKSAARALLRVITSVIEYSELEAGRVRIDAQNFVFSELFDQLKPEFEKTAARQRNRISFDLDPDIGCIRTDWRRLRQCVEHLVDNAAKFTRAGEIIVRAQRQAQTLQIEVTDTGCGIDPRHAPNLMSPFVQADASLTREYGGIGLGLAITGQLARQLGGALTFLSAPGRGSTFILRIAIS